MGSALSSQLVSGLSPVRKRIDAFMALKTHMVATSFPTFRGSGGGFNPLPLPPSGVGTKSTLRERGAVKGPGFLERGLTISPHQLGGFLESYVSFPSRVRGETPADKNFLAFMVLQVSCPTVLLCKTVCFVGPQYRCTI